MSSVENGDEEAKHIESMPDSAASRYHGPTVTVAPVRLDAFRRAGSMPDAETGNSVNAARLHDFQTRTSRIIASLRRRSQDDEAWLEARHRHGETDRMDTAQDADEEVHILEALDVAEDDLLAEAPGTLVRHESHEGGRRPESRGSPTRTNVVLPQTAPRTAPSDSSLRTTAMLQALRRNSTISPNSRSQLQRYVLEGHRDVSTEPLERRSPSPGSHAPSPSQQRQLDREQAVRHEHSREQDSRQAQLSSAEHRRRRALWQNASVSAASSARDRIRMRTTPEHVVHLLAELAKGEDGSEAFDTAEDCKIDIADLDRHDERDFLLSGAEAGVNWIPAPAPSSYLQPGCVLSGRQHATREYPPLPPVALGRYAVESRARPREPRPPSPVHPSAIPDRPSVSSSSVIPATLAPPAHPPYLPPHLSRPQRMIEWHDAPSDHEPTMHGDRWPVKLTISAVNHDDMTLSGTMEASNVPDKTSPVLRSSIATYLEGEIIDFNRHTLETTSFEAGVRTDATYWRKLPPFDAFADDQEFMQALMSRSWLAHELMSNWVLMRWKEKHFVSPADATSSLTICGFYYVSMRRSDGQVDGLYYDPGSTPYQHLSLKPGRGMFPSMQVR